MKRAILIGSMAAGLCLGVAAPVLAAQPALTGPVADGPSFGKNASTAEPAKVCLSDLRTFDSQMEKSGYWLSGSGYGYGYPMGGYGYPVGSQMAGNAASYQSARPGYEIRTLVASANILARHGQ